MHLQDFLYAINCNDGSILWSRKVGSLFIWDTPVIADINADGQLDIVLGTADSVIALNASDASTLWKVPGVYMQQGMTVGNFDNDSVLEAVLSIMSEQRTAYYDRTGVYICSNIIPGNKIIID